MIENNTVENVFVRHHHMVFGRARAIRANTHTHTHTFFAIKEIHVYIRHPSILFIIYAFLEYFVERIGKRSLPSPLPPPPQIYNSMPKHVFELITRFKRRRQMSWTSFRANRRSGYYYSTFETTILSETQVFGISSLTK